MNEWGMDAGGTEEEGMTEPRAPPVRHPESCDSRSVRRTRLEFGTHKDKLGASDESVKNRSR